MRLGAGGGGRVAGGGNIEGLSGRVAGPSVENPFAPAVLNGSAGDGGPDRPSGGDVTGIVGVGEDAAESHERRHDVGKPAKARVGGAYEDRHYDRIGGVARRHRPEVGRDSGPD